MQPIFFPFTDIAAAALSAINALLDGGLVVYRPSRLDIPPDLAGWSGEGRLELRIPASGDEETIAALLREYREWAGQRSSGERIALGLVPAGLPFFDAQAPAHIRSLLRMKMSTQGQPDAAGRAAADETLMRARLFLHLAQDFDRQQEEIDRDLRQCREVERRLTISLHGSGELAERTGRDEVAPRDPGAHATTERIGAWCRLMELDPRQAGGQAASALFLTTSPAVFACLCDEPTLVRPLQIHEIVLSAGDGGPDTAAGRERCDDLARLAMGQTPWPHAIPAAAEGQIRLHVIRFEDRPPVQLFRSFIRGEDSSPPPSAIGPLRHTLVGLVMGPRGGLC